MSQAFFEWNSIRYEVDLNDGFDLSIPYGSEDSSSAWNCPPVQFSPVQEGSWIGSVEAGASVNFFNIQFNPHGNGTHTEWAGHILPYRGSVNSKMKKFWFVSFLAEVKPDKSGRIKEPFSLNQHQQLPEALILRTHKDYERPKNNDYSGTNPPFLDADFVKQMVKKGVKHLLLDLPSVDPEQDGGELIAHKTFWSFEGDIREEASITELIRVPEELEEGLYFLNLQLAPFENDASPSRPVIYPWTAAHEH
jgi:kynurenine formamidase